MARVFISHSSRDAEQSKRMQDWLTNQGFEAPFLDFDKHAGIPPGSNWEQVLYREVDQSEAMIIIQTPNWLESKWCFAEFTQARALGKPIFPVIETPSGERRISSDIQALDLTKDDEGGLDQLGRELTRIALDAQGGFDWDASRPPFPGLLAFQEEDAAIYFGRDDDIRRLIERLNARAAQGGAKLIALLGASGSGKSSLMRAGVIPRLKRAGRHWIVLPVLRPERRPMDQFARILAIATGRGADWRELRAALTEGDVEGLLSDLAADLSIQADANEAKILLPVDQAEELFGAADPDHAKSFLKVLSTALGDGLPFLALFAMRSDFLGGLQAAPGLTARFEEFSLAPMPLVRIPQIIEGPARVAGLGVEDAFVQQAARDAETEDALPLLAFALRKLYDTSASDNYLSYDEYMSLGDELLGLSPLENAVRRAADKVLAESDPHPNDLIALRDAFVPDLVRINDQGEYVRQPARWDSLPARAHPLLERLANDRLLIIRQEGDAKIVDVAHEALLRKWPRLHMWLDEAREFLSGRQQMEQDRYDWDKAPPEQKDAALLTGLKLIRARGWMAERPHQLDADERAYIQRSIDRHETEERRKARQRRIISLGSIAAAVLLAAFGAYSYYQKEQADAALSKVDETMVERAREQIGFVWSDLADEQEELRHLVGLAERFNVHPYTLEPDKLAPKRDGFNCDPQGLGLRGGFRYLYCGIRDVISYQRLESISGINVYRDGGPHDGELDLVNTQTFGHYNPAFITWLGENIIPSDDYDPKVNAATRMVYDYQLGIIVRALYRSHRILFATDEEREVILKDFEAVREMDRQDGIPIRTDSGLQRASLERTQIDDFLPDYTALMENGVEGFGSNFHWIGAYFASKYFTEEEDDTNRYYIAIEASHFWLRRSIDGTEAQLFKLVKKVLEIFEPEVLSEQW